jgi:hypothetical protein
MSDVDLDSDLDISDGSVAIVEDPEAPDRDAYAVDEDIDLEVQLQQSESVEVRLRRTDQQRKKAERHLAMVARVKEKRISEATKKKYQNRLKIMLETFQNNHSVYGCFLTSDHDNFCIPFPDTDAAHEAIELFFGEVISQRLDREEEEKKNSNSSSQLQNAVLAIGDSSLSSLCSSLQLVNNPVPMEVDVPVSGSNSSTSVLVEGSPASAILDAAASLRQLHARAQAPKRTNKGRYKHSLPSLTTVQSFKSAIRHIHQERHLAVPIGIECRLKLLMAGFKKTLADSKQKGQLSVREGKYELTFAHYQHLAKFILKAHSHVTSQHFAWCFLILQWNLISRSQNIASILLQHLTWLNDSLVVYFPVTKTDQTADMKYPRHVYANPLFPHICPILSLAVHVFSRSFSSVAARYQNALFDGGSQEDRFSHILSRVLEGLSENDRSSLDEDPKKFGTHSIRKGACTYCAGMKDGPQMHSIFLRAGWTLSSNTNRYIFQGSGGDQLTGRVVSGLPLTDTQLATLPPRFKPDTFSQFSVEKWESLLPGYSSLPRCFQSVVPYLIASICYHVEWLRTNLPSNSPLFSAPLFSQNHVSYLTDSLCHDDENVFGKCMQTGMQATGIPSILLTSMMVKKMRVEVTSKLDTLPSMVSAEILRKCVVNGAVPVTTEDLERMRSNIVSEMNTALQNSVSEMYRVSSSVVAGLRRSHALYPGASLTNSSSVMERFTLFAWSNAVAEGDNQQAQLELHRAPKDFSFPRKNIKHIWILWFFGDLKNKVSPYRLFTSSDLSKQELPQKTRTKQVMNCLERLGIVATLEKEASSNPSFANAQAVSDSFRRALIFQDSDSDEMLSEKIFKATSQFDLAFDYLIYLIPNHVGHELRKSECALNTIYNNIKQHGIDDLLLNLEKKNQLRA